METDNVNQIDSVEEELCNKASDSKETITCTETDVNLFKTPFLITTKNSAIDPNDSEKILSQNTQNIPYSPPDWKTSPSSENPYFIEVIKNGIVIEKIYLKNLKNDSFICVGRFPPCEILLNHPSVSRYHCILQHGKLTNKDEWYLYDLGSTHGTRLNKKVIKKRCYISLQAGYIFQFAGSSRVFSFCIKEEMEKNEILYEKSLKTKSNIDNQSEPKYYAKDPIVWLERFFEREGVAINFQYTKAEKGINEWVCSIELPDISDGGLINGTGLTRKLAQFDCAMKACDRLQSAGILESVSLWNKRATYVENDYYDSDEDTFYDRTGQIEVQQAKRKKRFQNDNSNNNSELKTHEDIKNLLKETEEKINIVKDEIQRLNEKQSLIDSEGNKILRPASFSTRMTLSQMRLKEKRFNEELNQLKKLYEITAPNTLNNKFPLQEQVSDLKSLNKVEFKLNSDNLLAPSIALNENNLQTKEDSNNQLIKKNISIEVKNTNGEGNIMNSDKNIETEIETTSCLSTLPNNQNIILPKFGLITKEEARIKKPTIVKKRLKMDLTDSLENDSNLSSDYNDISHEDYSTWLPPEDQTGDGITKLNKKFEGRY